MRKIKYPLIVSDFDGTLVNDDGTIAENNKAAISAYIQAGGKFAISTGRMPAGILARARELGLKGVVCCCQGANIMEIESGEMLMEGRISPEMTYEICKKMEELGLHIHVYDAWDFYCNMDDEALKLYEKAVRTKGKLVLDKPISEFVKEQKLVYRNAEAVCRLAVDGGVALGHRKIVRRPDVIEELVDAQTRKAGIKHKVRACR